MKGYDKLLLNVAIYIRLSQEDSFKLDKDDDSESIKNQRNMLIDYINKHDNFVFFDEYCDEDLSGAGIYRPEFERLISDCKKGKIDVVLCKSQSRFSRDMEVVEKYINNKFIEWGVRFISLVDNADTDNLGNKKARQINGLVNEWYLEDISNNIRSAFKTKMMRGEFISPFASYGYTVSKIDNNKIVVDEEASQVVKLIYSLYLSGYGFSGITNFLNKENIASPSLYKFRKGIKLNVVSNKPRSDIKWNINAVKKILTNEIYIGNLIQGKRTTINYKNHKIISNDKEKWIRVENTHEAIIDKDTFFKVQELVKSRIRQNIKSRQLHIFSGKVFCNVCGKIMRKKNSKKYGYLVCDNNCNNKKGIRYDDLIKIVLYEINNKVSIYYDYDKLSKEYNDRGLFLDKISILNNEKRKIENNIINFSEYKRRLYEDKVNGVISSQMFKDLINYYEKKNNSYLTEVNKINKKIDYYKKANINSKYLLDSYIKFDNLTRYIFIEFIDKIYIDLVVNNERKIIIKWNFYN